jgi:RNA-directed DNA polymerase
VNTGEPLAWPDLFSAQQRVRRMQAKPHHWAAGDPGRRFDDLFNLVCHPDFLVVAWERVRGSKGARTRAWTGWFPGSSPTRPASRPSWATPASN